MNTKLIASLATMVFLMMSSRARSFINFDFESAQNLPASYGPVAVANALPGWTVFYGTNQQTQIFLDFAPFLGVTLQETNSHVTSGNFSVGLGIYSAVNDSYLSQTGLIPDSTESLLFEMTGAPTQFETILVVSLGGQNLSYSAISTNPNYTLYGADVPAGFAGQMEALTFSTFSIGPAIAPPSWVLDNIQFSPSPAPEPSEFALAGLSGLLFILCLRGRLKYRSNCLC